MVCVPGFFKPGGLKSTLEGLFRDGSAAAAACKPHAETARPATPTRVIPVSRHAKTGTHELRQRRSSCHRAAVCVPSTAAFRPGANSAP